MISNIKMPLALVSIYGVKKREHEPMYVDQIYSYTLMTNLISSDNYIFYQRCILITNLGIEINLTIGFTLHDLTYSRYILPRKTNFSFFENKENFFA